MSKKESTHAHQPRIYQPQKDRIKYTITYEGKCEYLYFKRLQNIINEKLDSQKQNKQVLIENLCKDEIHDAKKSSRKLTNKGKMSRILTNMASELRKNPHPHFHICDTEVHPREGFIPFVEKLSTVKKEVGIKIELGYSCLCFELWMIFHKTDFQKQIKTPNDYLDPIKNTFGKELNKKFERLDDYKNKDNFNACLGILTLDDVTAAIQRAEKVMELKEEKPIGKFKYCPDNPALSIHKCVKTILLDCGLWQENSAKQSKH